MRRVLLGLGVTVLAAVASAQVSPSRLRLGVTAGASLGGNGNSKNGAAFQLILLKPVSRHLDLESAVALVRDMQEKATYPEGGYRYDMNSLVAGVRVWSAADRGNRIYAHLAAGWVQASATEGSCRACTSTWTGMVGMVGVGFEARLSGRCDLVVGVDELVPSTKSVPGVFMAAVGVIARL